MQNMCDTCVGARMGLAVGESTKVMFGCVLPPLAAADRCHPLSLFVCAWLFAVPAVDVSGLRQWGARRRAAGATGRDSSTPRVVEALALPDTKGMGIRPPQVAGMLLYGPAACMSGTVCVYLSAGSPPIVQTQNSTPMLWHSSSSNHTVAAVFCRHPVPQ
jgi:hypothetical protein